VAEALEADLEEGLSDAEAASRLARWGPNALPEEKPKSLLAMFLSQFKDVLVLILVGAAIVSFAVGEETDAIAIAAILLLNAVLGTTQERRASQALAALKRMSVPDCEVVRGGDPDTVSSEAVVPGDLVTLREGDLVPADLRLTEAHSLRMDEASLTGESEPVTKSTEPVDGAAALGDRLCMAYAGTTVTYGRGVGVCVATGTDREIGRIAQLLEERHEAETPLQRRLAGFGKLLGGLTLGICAVIFVLAAVRGEPLLEAFMVAVSLAVAAIPEGLPAIVTVVLALGVRRMSRHRAIVRKLPAVETLGCATTICTDKTGTLTENRMRVEAVWLADAEPDAVERAGATGGSTASAADDTSDAAGTETRRASRRRVARIAALCNDARIQIEAGETQRFGDPTELALVEFAAAEGENVEALRESHPRLGEVPFDSDRKRMSTVHELDGRRRLLVKGAPDVLLPLCTHRDAGGRAEPIGDAADRAAAEMDAMAGRALRVLALAWKDLPEAGEVEAADESGLVLVGLVGMRDAPRAAARPALDDARSAGIRTVMVTGDNIRTAEAIARDLGMLEEGDECLTSQDLREIPEADLAARIRRVRVFARVWPEQKLTIVRALQSDGEVVAMTGDGVNDAPALQQADIGVAMGITGTDVAQAAADVVLTDDNFATIVEAVEQGRIIFDNIRKFVTYLLSCNLGEILAVMVPVMLGLGAPLVPVQILLINLVTDGLPALALGVDHPEPDIMARRPRRTGEGILTRELMGLIGYNALFIGLAVVLAYGIGRGMGGVAVGRTMAFMTLGVDELLRAFSSRSVRRNLWHIDPRTNLALLAACVLSAGILLVAVLVPAAQHVCHTVSLTGGQWATALALSAIPLAALEAWKVVRRLATRAAV